MFKRALFVALLASVTLLLSSRTDLFLQLKDLAKTKLVSPDPSHETSSNDSAMSTVNQSVSRSVVKKVLSIEQSEGAGARVRRSIGTQELRNLTPFLMLDHFHISEGAGFPDHPHRGQATVTYMLQGSSRHEDSVGNKGTIEAGGVQWMCAGRGVMHAEMPVSGPGVPEPRGLQLWVDLPKEFKMVEPSYQELGPEQIPSAFPDGSNGAIELKMISGNAFGVESPVRPLGGCWYMHVIFKRAGEVFIDLPPGWTSFLYILDGSLQIGSAATTNGADAPTPDVLPHDAFHTLVLSASADESGVLLRASARAEAILVAGAPLDQGVVQHGPFVMTTADEIRKTLLDYRMGINGFEKARTWKSKIGGR